MKSHLHKKSVSFEIKQNFHRYISEPKWMSLLRFLRVLLHSIFFLPLLVLCYFYCIFCFICCYCSDDRNRFDYFRSIWTKKIKMKKKRENTNGQELIWHCLIWQNFISRTTQMVLFIQSHYMISSLIEICVSEVTFDERKKAQDLLLNETVDHFWWFRFKKIQQHKLCVTGRLIRYFKLHSYGRFIFFFFFTAGELFSKVKANRPSWAEKST